MTLERALEMLTETNSVGDKWSHQMIIEMIYRDRAEEICKNCKHFNSEYKECLELTYSDWDCYNDQPAEDGKLVVQPDFGCNKWESI